MPLKNWAKYISLLTVLTLGVLLIPNASYACAKNMRETTRSSCAKKQEKDAQPKDFNKAQFLRLRYLGSNFWFNNPIELPRKSSFP